MIRPRCVTVFLVAWVLAGCSSTPLQEPAASAGTPAATGTGPAPAAASARSASPIGSAAAAPAARGNDVATGPAERSVYFGFDEALLAPRWFTLVEQHGRHLSRQPALRVRVEGHADERGGAEYNLALGQRRASAVSQALQIQGVRAGQIEAVSFGKERPKALGHDESAWAQNRRADIVPLALR